MKNFKIFTFLLLLLSTISFGQSIPDTIIRKSVGDTILPQSTQSYIFEVPDSGFLEIEARLRGSAAMNARLVVVPYDADFDDPIVDTAWTVNDSTVQFQANEYLNQDSINLTDFTVYEGTTIMGTDSVWISGANGFIRCDSVFSPDSTLTFSYTRGSIQDTTEAYHKNYLASFTDSSITNTVIDGNPLLTNLDGYWAAEESSGNAIDSTGNNDLTASNITYSTTGQLGNAFTYNGTSSVLGNTRITDYEYTSNFSVGAWIRIDATGSFMTIMSNFHWTGDGWDLTIDDTGYIMWSVRNQGETPTTGAVTSATQLSASTWYFVVGTFDGTTVRLYINNAADGTPTTWNYNVNYDATSIFAIGARKDGLWFDGEIDDSFIYGRVLSLSEVQDLYNSGSGLAYPFE